MATKPTTAPAEQSLQSTASHEQPIMVWDAKEFVEYQRDRSWYVLVALGSVAAAVLVILGQTFLLGQAAGGGFIPAWVEYAILIIVFGLTGYVVLRHAGDTPRTITYSLTKLGIQVGERFYPYSELRSYWIVYKLPVQTLYVQSTNRFKPLIRVDLASVDPLQVKTVLKDYLPEEQKRSEDFLDKFSRLIRL